MDALIRKANFVHNDENKRESFDESLQGWLGQNVLKSTSKDISKALTTLADKMTEKKFPDFNTEGWNQAFTTFEQIIYMYSALLSEDKIKQNSVHSDCYDFVLRLLKFGPGTIHMKLVTSCITDFELQEHFQSLTGEKLKQLIHALTTDVKPKEKVTEEEFYDYYKDFMRTLMDYVFSKDQLTTHEIALMDFFMHLNLDFGHLEERSCELLAEAAENIYSALDTPWMKFKDITHLKSYLKHCGNTFKNPNSLKSETARDIAKGVMINLLDALGQRRLVEEFYQEVFDLALDISKYSGNDDDFVMRTFEDCVKFFSNVSDFVPKKPAFFQQAAKKFCEVTENIALKFLSHSRFSIIIVDDFLIKSYGNAKQSARQWVELMIPLFKHPCVNTLRACSIIINEDKSIKWAEYPEVAQKVFDSIISIKIPVSGESDEAEENTEFTENLSSVITSFIDGLRKSKMLKNYGGALLKMAVSLIEMKDENLIDLAENIADKIELNAKNDKAEAIAVMKRVHTIVQTEDYPWHETRSLSSALQSVVRCCSQPFKDGKIFTDTELKIYVDVCISCLEHEAVHPDDVEQMSCYYDIFVALMDSLSQWLTSTNKFDLAAEMVPKMMKTFEADHEHVTMLNCRFFIDFAQATSGLKILGPYLNKLIEIYLELEQADLLRVIDSVYPYNIKGLNKHFQAFLTILDDSGNMEVTMWLGQLFHKASKKQPELFTEKNVEMIINKAKEDMSNQPTLLQILQELCKRQPKAMVKHIDLLLDVSGWNPMLLSWMNDMYCSVALYDKSVAPKVLTHLLMIVKSNQDKANLLTGLNSIRMIGFKYPDLIKPQRTEIANLKLMDPDGQNLQQTILDLIDGKTPEELRKQLESQQKDFSDLVGRVEETEEAVVNINTELDRQGAELDNVRNDVNEQGQRLDQVEETVDETVLKVEEIDQKTLSHAPYWSRDVSQLLNPLSEHDWRLLASRLGYSNDDIRGWAQQADPCMAMLNEWYAVRKTSEATFAILTQLQEMNRMDAAIIVENAMKNAEAVVEDEDFEYASPPPIFISYQWGHQPEVKLLKQHLEMAGYDCWLDIGQMGGGDKLFEKIDNGIRAAKIVISCVTEKYAKSPNCNREVNLATSLNKGVIPLLLEKCTWPPPGSMGPIFSEYLFIRFFQRAGEELEDERYWPKDKFQELLMQLNMFGLPPDDGKIEPIYRNWWMPMVEEIKIDKSKTKDGGQVSAAKVEAIEEKAAVSPDVFISYQWGKQKNIIKLYERLTSLGLSCWLDIKQMGGGDSLYDKIDKGVRGSKVVISCVTTKYSLSANCRREVSLADALKRPLIPILLEKMTWPPAGPMSMVMTQLLYIDFTKDETIQMMWEGPPFQQLLDKIYGHMPRSITQESTGEMKQSDDSSKKLTKRHEDEKATETSLLMTNAHEHENKPNRDAIGEEENRHLADQEKLQKENKNNQRKREDDQLKEDMAWQKKKELERLRKEQKLHEEREKKDRAWKEAQKQREEQKKRDEQERQESRRESHYGLDNSKKEENKMQKEESYQRRPIIIYESKVSEASVNEGEVKRRKPVGHVTFQDKEHDDKYDTDTVTATNSFRQTNITVTNIPHETKTEPHEPDHSWEKAQKQQEEQRKRDEEEKIRYRKESHYGIDKIEKEEKKTFQKNDKIKVKQRGINLSKEHKHETSPGDTPVINFPKPPPSQQTKIPHYKFHRPPLEQPTSTKHPSQHPGKKAQIAKPSSTRIPEPLPSRPSSRPPPSQQQRVIGDRVPSLGFKTDENPRRKPTTSTTSKTSSNNQGKTSSLPAKQQSSPVKQQSSPVKQQESKQSSPAKINLATPQKAQETPPSAPTQSQKDPASNAKKSKSCSLL